jgi:hypothetical protein
MVAAIKAFFSCAPGMIAGFGDGGRDQGFFLLRARDDWAPRQVKHLTGPRVSAQARFSAASFGFDIKGGLG